MATGPSDILDDGLKTINDDPEGVYPETLDDKLKREKVGLECAYQKRLGDQLKRIKNELKCVYSSIFKDTQGNVDEKETACRKIYDQLNPRELLPSEFLVCDTKAQFKIDFSAGEKELTEQLEAVSIWGGILSDRAQRTIAKFVKHINKGNAEPMDCMESVRNALESVNGQDYIGRKIMELEKAGEIKWDTKDGKAVKEGTKFWTLNYGDRKQHEASQLHSHIKSSRVPHITDDSKELLPVMYWLEQKVDGPTPSDLEQKGSAPVWVKYDPKTYDRKVLKKEELPKWTTDYIDKMEMRLVDKLQTFLPGVENPSKRDNAVYLLLCRFNGEGVPNDARVQAYAGKATNGVEKRWSQHADKSMKLISSYNKSTKFSESPLKLGSPLLVEVMIGRLYAQGGRRHLTENDTKHTEHDNIALFVYRAYGENKTKDNIETKCMEEKEKYLISKLKLRDMKYGMNGRLQRT